MQLIKIKSIEYHQISHREYLRSEGLSWWRYYYKFEIEEGGACEVARSVQFLSHDAPEVGDIICRVRRGYILIDAATALAIFGGKYDEL